MAQGISLLNTVIGPVMRGPSSSHSAAPFLIGRTIRELALEPGEALRRVRVSFDPAGSFAAIYRNQGSDEGFAAGLSGVAIASDSYPRALRDLHDGGAFQLSFDIAPLARNDHPNRVDVAVTVRGADGVERTDSFEAVSLGGGTFIVTRCNDHTTGIDGSAYTLLVEHSLPDAESLVQRLSDTCGVIRRSSIEGFAELSLATRPTDALLDELRGMHGVTRLRVAAPAQELVRDADATLPSASELLASQAPGADLANYALAYESALLGQAPEHVEAHFSARVALMADSVARGLGGAPTAGMRHLRPSASALAATSLPQAMDGGFLKAAMAGALAAMEQSSGRGVVCAAPTAGSAGIVPGALHGLRTLGASDNELRKSLQVMALVGALFATRGSFAAETGGCSVETGASAAMAAAGIAHHFGASPQQVLTAASLCLMNTLGLVCDPVGGDVEIPCHARNIAGIGHAWTASIAALGGFDAVIPFDELVDQTVKVGERMHPDLRCTARGGCAATPTALTFTQRP